MILDSSAPQAPHFDALDSPTNVASQHLQGSAEAFALVKISRLVTGASPEQIGLVQADANGRFILADVVLSEGVNQFTAIASDAAGNQSEPGPALAIVLDTAPPVISMIAPEEGLFSNAPTLAVSGSVDELLSSLTVNGLAAVLNGQNFLLDSLALLEGNNTIVVTATDLAGNSASVTRSMTQDLTPPIISISTPSEGGVTRLAQIDISGAVDEPITALTLNGGMVGFSGQTFNLSSVPLVEGLNLLTLAATDRAGNLGSASVSVTSDSIPPEAPHLIQPLSPTNQALTLLAGTAEAGSSVVLSVQRPDGSQDLLASLSAGADGSFSLAGIPLSEGVSLFSATASDAAGNQSAIATLEVELDSIAPVISVSSPENNSISDLLEIRVTGQVDENEAVLTIDGVSVPLTDGSFAHPLTLQPGANRVILLATDLAGNVGTASLSIQADGTPPEVVISSPLNGQLINQSAAIISGSVNEDNVNLTLNAQAVTMTGRNFNLPFTLNEGLNSLIVTATDQAGNIGSARVEVTLDSQAPQVDLTGPASADAGSNLILNLGAADSSAITQLELRSAGVVIWSGSGAGSGTVSQSVPFSVSPNLKSGEVVTLTAQAVDVAGNSSQATLSFTVDQGASGPGYLQGEAYDDSRGLLLADVEVRVSAADNSVSSLFTGEDGGYFFELPAGDYLVTLSKPGYTRAERLVSVQPELNLQALDARLTPISGEVQPFDLTGGLLQRLVSPDTNGPMIELQVPADSLENQVDLRLLPLSNQGLASSLPQGWSPLAAWQLQAFLPNTSEPDPAGGLFLSGANLRIPLPKPLTIDVARQLVLASYSSRQHKWLASGTVALSDDGSSVYAVIGSAGDYALLLADPAPNAPPLAAIGQPLGGVIGTQIDSTKVVASGQVVPFAAPPKVGLLAAGEVLLTAADGITPLLPSGTQLNGRVVEQFALSSGASLQPAAYIQDLIFYRAPCLTNIGLGGLATEEIDGLRTSFPVSPSRDFTVVDLLMGKVGIEILPPENGVDGVMVGSEGARLIDNDGNVLEIPAGALATTSPVKTATIPAGTAEAVVGTDFTLIRAVDIDLTRQTLALSASLSVPAPSGLNPALPLLLARSIEVGGKQKLTLVGSAEVSGSTIVTRSNISAYPATASAIDLVRSGIDRSGSYYILQAKADLGFVQGQVSGAGGALFQGALVSSDRGSLIDLSATAGRYLLAASLGDLTVIALDQRKADSGQANGALDSPRRLIKLDLQIEAQPPRVLSVDPADGSAGVESNITPLITFSETLDRASVTAASLKLSDSAGNNIPGVFSFNPSGTTVTFYPEISLASETAYTLSLAADIRDLQGYTLGSRYDSHFTVRDTTPPAMPPAGSISATFPDADGLITVSGTQGSVELGATVLVINDTSGEIVGVQPAANGSFTARINAQLGDEIQVVMMDAAGNQTLISYLTFKSADGRYLVTTKGGKVEGESGLQLDIPDGALFGPAVVKITPVAESELPHPVPDETVFLGAVNLDNGGMPFQKEVKLSIPAPADLPADASFFVAQPKVHINADGSEEQVYVIIDSAKLLDGRITTASPPFAGITGFGIFTFVMAQVEIGPVIISGTTYRDMNGDSSYLLGTDRPIEGAVIRSPGAYNFIAYSDSQGHYASYGFTVNGVCRNFNVMAIHPLTMFRNDVNITTCDQPYIVNRLNFKLADEDTMVPDDTSPVVELGLKVVPGQDASRLIAGTIPLGAELELTVAAIDSDIQSMALEVLFQAPDMPSAAPVSPAPTLNVSRRELYSAQQGESAPLFRTRYVPQFSGTIAGTTETRFLPDAIGTYTLTVTAEDSSGNRAKRSVSVRTLNRDEQGMSIDGRPRVDAMLPDDGSVDVMVTSKVVAWFSEPVENVDETSFTLVDEEDGATVPAWVYVSVEGGKMLATLVPKGNLAYGRTYRATLSTGITDIQANPSAPSGGDGKLPLDETSVRFTTKEPRVFDLVGETFSGGRDVDFYTQIVDGRSFVYVTAGTNGWRAVEVTDPTKPVVVHEMASPASGWSYRGVAVYPEEPLLGITENIYYPGGGQYGYVRFYDLSNPAKPTVVGQEKLAEAYSGIPGRLALAGNYAYVATVGAGIQVIDIEAAKNHSGSSDGSSIVGGYSSAGQGFGEPNDVRTYAPGRMMVTSNGGYLLLLDTSYPSVPSLLSAWRPDGNGVGRAAIAGAYAALDADGNQIVLDLAVAGLRDGHIVTLDVSDPYNVQQLGTVVDESDVPVIDWLTDLTLSKEAGLAFVTTINSIKVIDIKDPTAPRLLISITTLPDENGNLVALGSIPALVEKGGWVYLGSDAKGLRVVDLDPSELKILNGFGELTEDDEFRFGDGNNPQKRYAIEIAVEGDNSLCTDTNYSGELEVLDADGKPVSGQTYELSFAPKLGSSTRCAVTLKGANNSRLQRFIVNNGDPQGLPADMLKLYGGLGGKIKVHVTAQLERTNKEKYFEAKIEPVGVIVLAIDGLRQDVLYDANERSYDDPNGCGVGQECYVDPASLPGLSQILWTGFSKAQSPTIALPDVTAIFPSITLASWASIFSGKMPNETGIMGNEFFARDLYGLNDATQPNDKLSVGVPARFGNPKGVISLDSGAFKGFGAFPKFLGLPYSLYQDDFFVPFQDNWKDPVAPDWTKPFRAVENPTDTQSYWPDWTPQNDKRLYKPDTLFEELRDNVAIQKYFKQKGGDPVVVSYNHYARGAYWLTWDTQLAPYWNPLQSSRLLDQASWDKFEEYLGTYDKYNDLPLTTKRNSTPFSALTVWYLPGLDHEAHIAGMGEYKGYLRTVIDKKIEKFVNKLKALDEFNNKIFIIVADHGHTAMPTDFNFEKKIKTINYETGNIINVVTSEPVEIKCDTEIDKISTKENKRLAEMANNNLHIVELAQIMGMFGKKVLAPKALLAAGDAVVEGMTTDIEQADIIAGLNGPMAHIYVKGTGNWGSEPEDDSVLNIAKVFWELLKEGVNLPEKQQKIVGKLGTSINQVLIWDKLLGHYKVLDGFTPEATPIYKEISNGQVFPESEYVAAADRIDGLRVTGKEVERSGDIVLLMNDNTTGAVSGRYTTGAACKSWHGSLNPSDSYVPMIISYPGGNSQLINERKNEVCSSDSCKENWALGKIIKTFIEPQF